MAKEIIFEIEHLDFSYGKNKVLNDISLLIERGKFYGIVGPNGCGKTTFLDLMAANREPVGGVIKFLGKDIKKYKKIALAKEIALVPQDFHVNFPFSVKEIILMGRHPHIPRFAFPSTHDLELADTMMEQMEITRFKERNITELSGGEQQRCVFARALVQDTPVLILDESTSELDIQHTLRALDIIADKVRLEKRTVIATFHNLNLAAAYCAELIFMKAGRIVSKGNTDEVLNEENIGSVFEVDSKIYFDRYSNTKQVVFKGRK
jgi:ABC-type cobalamin/Fe3+-siderophores transport system ATPase subunit